MASKEVKPTIAGLPATLEAHKDRWGNWICTLTDKTEFKDVWWVVDHLYLFKSDALYLHYTLPHNVKGLENLLHEHNFVFHSAFDNQWIWYVWKNRTKPCKIPEAAVSILGVTALVVSSNGRFAVVQEHDKRKHGSWGPCCEDEKDGDFYFRFPNKETGVGKYKLVSGAVDRGEAPPDTAAREIHEELGIPKTLLNMVNPRIITGGYIQRNARPGKIADVFLPLIIPMEANVDEEGLITPFDESMKPFMATPERPEIHSVQWLSPIEYHAIPPKHFLGNTCDTIDAHLEGKNQLVTVESRDGKWKF